VTVFLVDDGRNGCVALWSKQSGFFARWGRSLALTIESVDCLFFREGEGRALFCRDLLDLRMNWLSGALE
jgi:hypothetical protein